MAPLAAAEPVAKIARLSVVDAAEVDPSVGRAYSLAASLLEGLGLKVQRFATPDIDIARIRVAGFVEAAREAPLHFPEVASDPAGFSDRFRGYLGFAAKFDDAALAKGRATLDTAAARLRAVLLDAEAILMPTAPQPAFAHGNAPNNQADFTGLANIAGLPALSLPAGWDSDGLPVAVQLVGRPGSETALLDLAARLDAALNAYAPPPAYA
ncbi:MAG: amidase family protein, partial [Sphingomonadaceae bacterium]|nr:amidase family protein [Sphingomonadaceae bacterium]